MSSKISIKAAVHYNLRAIKIWWSIQPGLWLSVALASLFQTGSPYLSIYLAAQIINELAGAKEPAVLWKLVVLEVVLLAITALISAILKHWKNYEYSLRGENYMKLFMDKILSMDFAETERQRTINLLYTIRQNTNIGWGLQHITFRFENAITAITQILCGLTLSVSLLTAKVVPGSAGEAILNHPLCAIIILLLIFCTAIFSAKLSNKISDYYLEYQAHVLQGNRYFFGYNQLPYRQQSAADMRMYHQENMVNYYLAQSNHLWDAKSPVGLASRGRLGFMAAMSQGVLIILIGLIYLYVCLKAKGGAFGIGSITQYISAITSLFLGFAKLMDFLRDARANGVFIGKNFEFLDLPNEMYQGTIPTEKRNDREYEVEFRNVSFKYPEAENYALRHVNMKFRVGSRLAVVGMNGSGKTTFIKLLCRLYDPTEGEILLNGIDIRKYKYDDYLQIFSVVFQDFQLFALPLGQNVAAAKKYDRARAEDCLQKAGFGERLAAMPNGLDTYLYKALDKDGVEISGGEAQKIALARALYKDAPFIILDEPTAALDPIAEAEIYTKFNEIVGDKTAIYISHRLSSCKFCDEIAVFHEGQVIQQGSHESLVAEETGKYYELWTAQAQYYTENN